MVYPHTNRMLAGVWGLSSPAQLPLPLRISPPGGLLEETQQRPLRVLDSVRYLGFRPDTFVWRRATEVDVAGRSMIRRRSRRRPEKESVWMGHGLDRAVCQLSTAASLRDLPCKFEPESCREEEKDQTNDP
jgi:hypothetical protein